MKATVVLADLRVTSDLLDLAERLREGGTTPVLFAPVPSSQADAARRRGFEVVEDAGALAGRGPLRAHVHDPVAAILLRDAVHDIPVALHPEEVDDPGAHARAVLNEASSMDPIPVDPAAVARVMRQVRAWIQDERDRLDQARSELDARDIRVARRLESARKRDLFHYRAPPGTEEAIGDLADRAWRLQEFHDRVTRSTWFAVVDVIRRGLDRVFPWGTRRRGFVMGPARAISMMRRRGLGALLRHIPKVWVWGPALFHPAMPLPHSGESYQVWHRRRYTGAAVRRMRHEGRRLRGGPSFSIVMPTYDSEPAWLERAVGSIRAQVYPRWELCIADDASPRPQTRATLERLAAADPRITVRFLPQNLGISGASNAALDMATGDFVALVDHDDELKPDALLEVARLLSRHPDLDYVYTDEDKRAPDGRLIDVFFKPDWSPDLLLSMNYLSHLSVLRREVVDRVGGFRSAFDGSQDYDLVLRVTEVTDRIGHVPLPLYTWRVVPGSAAGGDEAKPWAYAAARRALEDALRRRGRPGTVDFGPFIGSYSVTYEVRDDLTVTAIVGGDPPDRLRDLGDLVRDVLPAPIEHGYGRAMNEVARAAGSDLLLFLDAGLVPLEPGWVRAMAEHASRDEVGAVGPRLLFPDGSRAHEGVVIGLSDPRATGSPGPLFTLGEVVRNCSAVTGACMMIRADVFWEFGGFDEEMGPTYGPTDLCLRAREKGYQIVYTPWATLGYEPSGDPPPDPGERAFRARWGAYRDPYYNPNLDLADPYAIRLA